MASKDPDEKCSNTKTGEETLALEKRRSKSRRVSFAETTAIHLFIRDEECETPPEEADNAGLHRSESDEIRELLAGDDDEFNGTGNGDDNDRVAVETSFLRPFESPNRSPGSYFGSATSNDEDNFFGPVSADFIKPGRLSNYAAYDDNHDVTMDSTAFSMHFRSLARSDSGGEFKTPTGVHLAFGKRTAQMSSTPSGGDLMVLSASRKRGSGSLLGHTVNDSGNSDDMSIVGENHHSYDYGKLPPELDVLLAEYGKDVGAISLTSQVECSNSNKSLKADAVSDLYQNGFEVSDTNRGIVAHHVSDLKKTFDGASSAVHVNIDNGNDGILHATLGETAHNTSNNMDDDLFPVIISDDKTTNPIVLTNVMEVDKDLEARKGAMEASVKFLSPLSSSQSNLNREQPIAGSVSSLLAKRRQIFRASPNDKSNLIMSEKMLSDQGSKHVLSASSFEKGVSRFKKLEAFPSVSASKAEGNASRLMPQKSIPSSLTRNYVLKNGNKDVLVNHLAAPVACLDKQFSNVAEAYGKLQSIGKMGRYNMRTTLGDEQCASHTEAIDAEMSLYGTWCTHDESTKFTGVSVSPLELLQEKRLEPFMSTDNQNKEAVVSNRSDSSLLEITFSDLKNNKETGMPNHSAFSPETSVERKVSASPLYQGSLSKNLNQQTKFSLDVDCDIIQEADDANVGITALSPSSCQHTSNHDENDQRLLKASNIYGIDSSSSLKRKLFDKPEDDNGEFASFQHKPKSCKDQKHYEEDSKVPHSIGGDAPARDWVDVLKNFLGTIKLWPSLIDNLDLAQIRMLNDNLVHLDKMRSYELLHCDMSSQKAFDSTSFLQIKRLADTKLLVYKMLYQRAKLQLLLLERDKLLDQVLQLDSKVEESKMLTSNCQGSGMHEQKDVEVHCPPAGSFPIDLSKTSLAAAEISLLRKDLEVSERKISNLNKSYHVYTKVMKEQTCTEMTVHVKNILRKRVACKSLQSEFQLCQVGSVKAMEGKLSVLFDHGGVMSQRFTVKSVSTYVSNVLNNVKISKMFLGMDACTAFSFVLCGETILAYSGIQTIAQVTQKSSSLLHTLLDVVEEVELAMMELRNLTDIRFLQPSDGKLDLRLCFTDFNSGARVALSIDITCLNWGIYPSQAVPYEVQGKAAKRYKSFQILLDNIKSTVRGVRCGHMRIINLCRCVSKTIQANCMS